MSYTVLGRVCESRRGKWIALLLVTLFEVGCSMQGSVLTSAPSPLVKHLSATSRDYYYFDLSRGAAPVSLTDDVGGEHMNLYYLLGFSGDKFMIQFDSTRNRADCSMSRDGIRVDQIHNRYFVTVEDPSVWIELSVSAYPDATYHLTMTKQP